MVKTTPSTSPKINLDFYILNAISEGKNPAKIWKELGTYKQKIDYHLKLLQVENKIRKVDYGVWEIVGQRSPNSTTPHTYGQVQEVQKYPSDFVRGHSLVFKIPIKQIRNWTSEQRQAFLKEHNILFNNLNPKTQRIVFENKKIWLADKSIVIYDSTSYFAETSQQAKSFALADLRDYLNRLSSYLHIENLNSYGFTLSKQHYALIKNALAKQYDREGKQLKVYDNGKCWLLIDNSLNLNELETIDSQQADVHNKKVQDLFNDIKKNESLLPSQITEFLKAVVIDIKDITKNQSMITNNQVMFDKNYSSHLNILWQLSNAVEDLRDTIKKSKRL